jgi:hypothetical protein
MVLCQTFLPGRVRLRSSSARWFSADVVDVADANRSSLMHLRVQRDALYEAIVALEAAVTVPAHGRVPQWLEGTRPAFERLDEMFGRHLRVTEAEGGFFETVLEESPRLAHAVQRLRKDHIELGDGIARSRALLDAAATEDDVDAARAALLEVVHGLLTHRHRGAELVYEAYHVDLASGD